MATSFRELTIDSEILTFGTRDTDRRSLASDRCTAARPSLLSPGITPEERLEYCGLLFFLLICELQRHILVRGVVYGYEC